MKAVELVNQLLDDFEPRLVEASVRLPPRGRVWIASFTGALPNERITRSTGVTDKAMALEIARQWEAEQRERRKALASQNLLPSRPKVEPGGLTQAEVAAVLRMSTRAVRNVEKRALAKLSRHPALRELWREYAGHVVENSEIPMLSREEVTALLGLARTPFELETLRKLLSDIPVR